MAVCALAQLQYKMAKIKKLNINIGFFEDLGSVVYL